MANTQKPEVTQEEIDKAKGLWIQFTKMSKWTIIAIIACLALMALALV